MKYTPENIIKLEPNEIFVFGSNTAGRSGAGAAKTAVDKFGAKYGVGVGMTGQCYAIPTKDDNIQTLPLCKIEFYVGQFLRFAINSPDKKFLVTKIGTGLASYKISDIAPLFFKFGLAGDNVILPYEFWNFK